MAFRSRAGIVGIALVVAGCRSQPTGDRAATVAPPREPPRAAEVAPAASTIARVSHERFAETTAADRPEAEPAGPLSGATELSLETLIATVEERNPSLQSMVAAWQAAAQRCPQVVALDDPMFQTMVAPASFGSSTVEPAYMIQASQKLPWYGKRELRGQAALAEANAAYYDSQESRVRLAEATRFAFFDYYVVERERELNAENSRVMREFQETAKTKYQANQVTQQDVLQADVELADLDRRQIELERMHRVAVARINTLLRRRPNADLPPPPRQLAGAQTLPQVEALEQVALEHRPDLAALQSRVQAEATNVQLACKQYYPDVEVFGRYDSFWQPASTMGDLRGQVGVSFNLPIYRGKLNAAVNEAVFRLNQRRAEYDQRVLDVQYEVQSAYAQLDESRKAVQLYAERFLPAAEQNVAVARVNYDVGKTTFLGLAQAQRQLIESREKQQQTIADYHRRLAELERVLASPVPQ